MSRFWFKGTATLSGVDFLIEADTKEEAIARARSGEWDDYVTDGADTSDWKIDANACEADE